MNTNENKSEDAFTITGNQEDQSKNLKEKFPQLTNADLSFKKGKENELLTKVPARLNKNREEVINIIKKGFPTS